MMLAMTDARRTTLELWQTTDEFKADYSYATGLVKCYLDYSDTDSRKAFRSRLSNFKQFVLSLDVHQKHRRDLHVKVRNYKL